jgi:hypothetical protein
MPPTIPTSFVPKQPIASGSPRATRFNVQGLFLLVSFIILGAALAASAGVFLYGRYLDQQVSMKGAELAQAQQNTNQSTVEEFVRLQQSLSAGETLLGSHVTLSAFFNLLESLTLQHVRFTSLKLEVADDRSAKLDATGQAASFNALAAESKAFSSDPHVENAIFSDFVTGKSGAVGFSLSATILPTVIADFKGASAPAAAATTTATAATTSTTTAKTATTTP